MRLGAASASEHQDGNERGLAILLQCVHRFSGSWCVMMSGDSSTMQPCQHSYEARLVQDAYQTNPSFSEPETDSDAEQPSHIP